MNKNTAECINFSKYNRIKNTSGTTLVDILSRFLVQSLGIKPASTYTCRSQDHLRIPPDKAKCSTSSSSQGTGTLSESPGAPPPESQPSKFTTRSEQPPLLQSHCDGKLHCRTKAWNSRPGAVSRYCSLHRLETLGYFAEPCGQ